jgi:hypothetical protein
MPKRWWKAMAAMLLFVVTSHTRRHPVARAWAKQRSISTRPFQRRWVGVLMATTS